MLLHKAKTDSPYRGRYGVWRMIYILIFMIILAGLGLTYYFIYQNIYSTIANTNAIASLRSNLKINSLDIPAFERSSAAIATKQNLEYFPSTIRNIFYFTPTSTPPVTTSTYATSSSRP